MMDCHQSYFALVDVLSVIAFTTFELLSFQIQQIVLYLEPYP